MHPDEDGFSVMAETYSQDPGSATNGGLYEDVYKGQMVPEFENWCFDASRQVGDYGIVKTTYGYHIMYCSDIEAQWIAACRSGIMDDVSAKILKDAKDQYPMEVDYKKIVLGVVDLNAQK